jgi:excisionase family DNA binding protein
MSQHTTTALTPISAPISTTTPGAGRPGPGRLVDQRQAASLAGCSRDTIVRARRAGRLPHSRMYGQRWLIAVDDLAAAGLLRPDGTGPDPASEPIAGRDGEQPSAALELARAEARICALQDLLARQDDELVFLRRLAVGQLDKAS